MASAVTYVENFNGDESETEENVVMKPKRKRQQNRIWLKRKEFDSAEAEKNVNLKKKLEKIIFKKYSRRLCFTNRACTCKMTFSSPMIRLSQELAPHKMALSIKQCDNIALDIIALIQNNADMKTRRTK
jgi:hypothetical protein